MNVKGGFTRANWYVLLTRAVEEGVARGYNQAHKHTSKPEESLFKNTIVEAIILEICEIINFECFNDQK